MKSISFPIVTLCLGLALISSQVGLFANPATAANPQGQGRIKPGAVVYSFNVQKGNGGFQGLTAGTPVTIRQVDGGWALIDYPSQVGGPMWVNLASVISYRLNP